MALLQHRHFRPIWGELWSVICVNCSPIQLSAVRDFKTQNPNPESAVSWHACDRGAWYLFFSQVTQVHSRCILTYFLHHWPTLSHLFCGPFLLHHRHHPTSPAACKPGHSFGSRFLLQGTSTGTSIKGLKPPATIPLSPLLRESSFERRQLSLSSFVAGDSIPGTNRELQNTCYLLYPHTLQTSLGTSPRISRT